MLNIHNANYVLKSDLLEGFSNDFVEEFDENLGRNHTWGDCNRSLIPISHFFEVIEEMRLGNAEQVRDVEILNDRITSLPDGTMVDLEN